MAEDVRSAGSVAESLATGNVFFEKYLGDFPDPE
jgi:hypothetical protein